MLIRLIAHARKGNPNLIDELIRIDGLPDRLVFRFKDGKRYLAAPWEPDVDVNIPKHIREHCVPIEITEDLPTERNQVTGEMQKPSDTRTILGVRINLDNNPGKELWTQLERIIDDATPRDRKVPIPAIVAPNQKDPFFLEAKDIPVVDLNTPKVEVPVTVAVAAEVPVIFTSPVKPSTFVCGVCNKHFDQQRGLWMHERKTRHKVKEPVAVGG